MTNLDMKKTLKHLYKPSAKKVSIVNIDPMPYLMIDGTGNPGTSERYLNAVQALYQISYGIRAIYKAQGNLFTVMPLEGLWSFEGQQFDPRPLTQADKDSFIWTLMILQPDFVTFETFKLVQEQLVQKQALANEVRFETYHEGDAVQIMHIGSYDDEAPTVTRLHDEIQDNGWQLRGKHHEIYISDPRKVDAAKLKTVIRQPFSREV